MLVDFLVAAAMGGLMIWAGWLLRGWHDKGG